jgi:tellurite resistance-related uncharacterized protein
MAEPVVDESTNAQISQALIAFEELPVLERSAEPDALHRTHIAREDSEQGTWRVRKQVRCRVLHAHSKIRRKH